MRSALLFLVLFLLYPKTILKSQEGYELWLGYREVESPTLKTEYQKQFGNIYLKGNSPIHNNIRKELKNGLTNLLGTAVQYSEKFDTSASLILALRTENIPLLKLLPPDQLEALGPESYWIQALELNKAKKLILVAADEKGLLYGAFHLLRLLQHQQPLDQLSIYEQPSLQHRVLNHWDNLDGTVERGYAGFSIWNWHQLPDYLDQRYYDYARANASIGINGTVITNVNANALVFREDYLEKAAALATIFRSYGIQLYLTARFSAPMELGGLPTADPLDSEVQAWWAAKVAQIYTYIPDFGGFLVKANSEGQPGPREYGRTHAEGANMLARALQPYGGIVMWRAFVYSEKEPEDRAKQAYHEFVPLDGHFEPNVMVQVKNGPVDFQPREPIHPLFGAMPNTPLMLEFQITKEYLGQGTHTVGLANMYEEVLQTDTYTKGAGSTVEKIIRGKATQQRLSGIAGVANIGTAPNWTGNRFAQADWYAFGRLAWNPSLAATTLFEEWTMATFGHHPAVKAASLALLDQSYEACVKYMTPLGLHHIMAAHHHYGPGPWVDQMSRADWTSTYYHKADSLGIGFNRSQSGSKALKQYAPGFAARYEKLADCPEDLLLWFHHLSWDHRMKDGSSLWEALCLSYQAGVDEITQLAQQWDSIKDFISPSTHRQVAMHLNIQVKEAKWWRDACLSYFQSFSQRPFPKGVEKPAQSLEHYKSISHPYAPGIRPEW